MPFNCTEHDLQSDRLDHCPRCWEIAQDKDRSQWQHNTPTKSEQEPSNSRGTLDSQKDSMPLSKQITEVSDRLTVLHSKFVGICSEQLTNFQPSTSSQATVDLYLRLQLGSVSFARLQRELRDLATLAETAHKTTKPSRPS